MWNLVGPVMSHLGRPNTELVKEPKDLLEYVIVHEMLLMEHGPRRRRFAGHWPRRLVPSRSYAARGNARFTQLRPIRLAA